ncbi:MAG: hypothetical protein Q4Q58_05140 [Thermoplasmata archaeon]|nr:hypothetical protein [Thermoplasmata archaeon]
MDRKLRKRVLEFANEDMDEPLFTHLESCGTLDGWDAYQPHTGQPVIIGLPEYVLVRGDEMRWSTYEESRDLTNRPS